MLRTSDNQLECSHDDPANVKDMQPNARKWSTSTASDFKNSDCAYTRALRMNGITDPGQLRDVMGYEAQWKNLIST
jgi:hypothetical protein